MSIIEDIVHVIYKLSAVSTNMTDELLKYEEDGRYKLEMYHLASKNTQTNMHTHTHTLIKEEEHNSFPGYEMYITCGGWLRWEVRLCFATHTHDMFYQTKLYKTKPEGLRFHYLSLTSILINQ